MTNPKPRVRKVAWVVLGVVALGLFAFLSCLYTATPAFPLRFSMATDDEGVIRIPTVLRQRFPWLPGPDVIIGWGPTEPVSK